MTNRAKIIFLLIFSLFACRTSEVNSMDSYCLKVTESFFKEMGTPNYAKALNDLLLSNRSIDFEDSAAVKLREGFKNLNEVSGVYLGHKLLKKRIVLDDIGVYSYLVKFEKKFYRFIFTFYNTGTKVNIYKFAYDDVLDLELEESLKLYTQ